MYSSNCGKVLQFVLLSPNTYQYLFFSSGNKSGQSLLYSEHILHSPYENLLYVQSSLGGPEWQNSQLRLLAINIYQISLHRKCDCSKQSPPFVISLSMLQINIGFISVVATMDQTKTMYILIYKSKFFPLFYHITLEILSFLYKSCFLLETVQIIQYDRNPTGHVSSYCIPEFRCQHQSVSYARIKLSKFQKDDVNKKCFRTKTGCFMRNTWCVQVLRSPKEAFAAAMQSWRERCEKCVCLQGDYVEK